MLSVQRPKVTSRSLTKEVSRLSCVPRAGSMADLCSGVFAANNTQVDVEGVFLLKQIAVPRAFNVF